MHSKIHQICETKSKKNIKYSVQKHSKQYYTKNQSKLYTACSDVVGEDGFEPSKRRRNRFTVCPHWPLGNSPIFNKWSWWTDSNPRPADYKSAALPAELHQHLNARIIYHKSSVESSPKSKKIEKIVYFPLLSSSVMTAAEFFAARAVNFE